MEKSLIITIMVDRVPLEDLSVILAAIEELLEPFVSKRIQTTIQDDRVVFGT